MNKSAGPLLIFFITLSVYVFTLHPTISPYRDSGDLIVAAHTLGVAHPPGYPLYTIIGKIFSQLLPWGNVAYKMNVMSAVFGAASIALAALICLTLWGDSLFIMSAALILAFAPPFWRLSQVSEMYSMNAFFVALLIFLTLKADTRKTDTLYLLAFVLGMSLGVHLTVIFILPGILWYAFKTLKIRPVQSAVCFSFFLLGASVYLFLPFRSITAPLLDWGHPANVENFLRVLTRADYGGMKLHPEESKFSWTAPLVFEHLLVYSKALISQFSVPAFLAALAGIVIKRKNGFFQFLFVSFFVSGPLFVIFSNLPPSEPTTLPILEPHFVMPAVFFAIFALAGFAEFVSKSFVKALIILVVAFCFAANSAFCNYRGHFFAYDYGRNIFASAKMNGIVYNPDDPTAFILTYLQVIEHRRPDIKLAAYFRTRWGYERLKKLYPGILPQKDIPNGNELSKTLLDYNMDRLPVYADLPQKFPAGYLYSVEGLLYRLVYARARPEAGPYELLSLRNAPKILGEYDFFTDHIISYYSSSYNNLGLEFTNFGEFDKAKAEYLRALRADPSLKPAYNNLGSMYFQEKDYLSAQKYFEKLITLDPADSQAKFNLALSVKAQGKLEDAKMILGDIWRNSSHPGAGNELGLMALNSGDPNSAEAIFLSLINKYPQYPLPYYNLGLTYKVAGNFEESRKYFRLYLASVRDPAEKREIEQVINALPKK
jgi:tetratricopeptide (TPR) repeat protein